MKYRGTCIHLKGRIPSHLALELRKSDRRQQRKYLLTNIGSPLTLSTRFGYLHSNNPTVRAIPSIILLAVFGTGCLWGQGGSSVTQSVTIEVKPISKISIAGNPNPLVISDATPGSNLTSVVDNNTKYSITTNLDNMKIVASINDRMPAGTSLLVQLSSNKAVSSGPVDLSNALSPVDVVTGIGRVSETNQAISYTFAANADVSEIQTQSRVVTLTLTN